ncbi:MAG: phosphoribosylglycinamide formyltransferase [Bdellovibrionales bacterium]
MNTAQTSQQVRLAVFASGSGSNFEHLVKSWRSQDLDLESMQLLCDRPGAGVIERAEQLKISYKVITPKDFDSFEDWDMACAHWLKENEINFVVLAGFLRKIGKKTLEAVNGKMINTHPSLLPKFGGVGMYGMRVHSAVIEAKEKQSGCTVHWVNENYDEGSIIDKKIVQVSSEDTPETLALKVQSVERPFLVSVLKSILRQNHY